jgi:hypothetical protein
MTRHLKSRVRVQSSRQQARPDADERASGCWLDPDCNALEGLYDLCPVPNAVIAGKAWHRAKASVPGGAAQRGGNRFGDAKAHDQRGSGRSGLLPGSQVRHTADVGGTRDRVKGSGRGY